MPILPGDILDADTLNHLHTTHYTALASSGLAPSSTDADIVGATVTFNTETDGAVAVITGDFDMDWAGAATNLNQGKCVVDGATQTGTANAQDGAATANDRKTVSRTWTAVLATAGSHTIKLTGTTNSQTTIQATHTVLNFDVLEVV